MKDKDLPNNIKSVDVRPTGRRRLQEIKESGDSRPVVYYEKHATIQVREFEFFKVTVGVSSPINPTEEERRAIKDTIIVLDEIIDEEIVEQLKMNSKK